MRITTWHITLLLAPVALALGILVLYWVIRIAVRAGIRDAHERRRGEAGGPWGQR